MSTLIQWIHLTAAIVGVGGLGFLLLILLPSFRVLNPDQRDLLAKAVLGRFRWASWSAICLLLASGLYNIRQYYWEVTWGKSWKLLTVKIVLAMSVFVISLGLTLPLRILERFRARRQLWLAVALALGLIVILISAYLRIPHQ
jgi:uncharacterized membrane protein